jgi:hypothetical protein
MRPTNRKINMTLNDHDKHKAYEGHEPCDRQSPFRSFRNHGNSAVEENRDAYVWRTARATTSFTSVGNAAECATKRIDEMGGNPQCLYRQALSPWGVAPGGGHLDVQELPLKGTGEVRCRPPRGQAWLRDHRASTRNDERPPGTFPSASIPCTRGQQPCSAGRSASF